VPARWLVVHARSPSDELNALLAEGLIACGGAAVEESGDWRSTWLAAPADVDATVRELKAGLEALLAGASVEMHWELRDDEDWDACWRAGLGPRRIGRRMIVTPGWTVPETRSDEIVITIDPQMAFGTGEHASTRGVLHLLEDAVPRDAVVLDAGTGSAVLAIAAVKLGAAKVIAVDFDADAIGNARENVERNGCGDRVQLEVVEIDDSWLRDRAAMFDVITANILSGVLHPLLPAFHGALRDGGSLLLGGLLENEAAAMANGARAAGLGLVAEYLEDGWWSGRFAR
jgi:ribosomal protein L11 methyltransferase